MARTQAMIVDKKTRTLELMRRSRAAPAEFIKTGPCVHITGARDMQKGVTAMNQCQRSVVSCSTLVMPLRAAAALKRRRPTPKGTYNSKSNFFVTARLDAGLSSQGGSPLLSHIRARMGAASVVAVQCAHWRRYRRRRRLPAGTVMSQDVCPRYIGRPIYSYIYTQFVRM